MSSNASESPKMPQGFHPLLEQHINSEVALMLAEILLKDASVLPKGDPRIKGLLQQAAQALSVSERLTSSMPQLSSRERQPKRVPPSSSSND